MLILCLWWFSLLLADLSLAAIYSFVYSQPLVVAGYYYYYYLSDNQWWQCIKAKEQAAYIQAGRLAEMGNCFRHNTYMYIWYLWCKDTILAILCTDLPISTTTAGKWFNILKFYGNIKCITTNGSTIVYAGADYMSCDDPSVCIKIFQ